jgi:hypothetical protein
MNDINWQSHEFLEVQSKTHHIEVRRLGIEIDQQVDVGPWTVLTASYRPEYARIRAMVTRDEFAHSISEEFDRAAPAQFCRLRVPAVCRHGNIHAANIVRRANNK